MKPTRKILLVSLVLAVPAPAAAVSTARPAGDGGVVLCASVPTGGIVNTGERVAFRFQSREDAAVLVFSIDSRGFVHLLHPLEAPEVSRANTEYEIPAGGSDLVVDTPTGVEFAFALAVATPSAIDEAELAHLRGTDAPGAEPYQISGDPFIAANMIAAELVRGVSHQEVYFGYTHFYVNDRVEYPCYLCGACDGVADDAACGEYRIVQNFDRASPLGYPLRRGYDMAEPGAEVYADTPEGSDVDINFYPYGSEVRYVDPSAYVYPYGWGWYDPYYWDWPGYYPYYSYPGWGWSIGIGWGWGWFGWGGYYCSGWYAPPCYYDPYYPNYPDGGYSYPEKFKTKYKSGDVESGSLTAQRAKAAQRDGSLRIAQRDVQKSVSKATRASLERNSRTATRETFMAGRNGAPRVKTSVQGVNRGNAGLRGAAGTKGTRPSSGIRGGTPSRGGSPGTIKRSPTGTTRGSSGAVKSTPRTRGSSSGIKGAPRGSSSGRGSPGAVRGPSRGSSGSAPAMRNGGSRNSAPAMRGGSFKSAPRPSRSR